MSIHWGGRGAGHISRWSASTSGVPSLALDFLSGTLDPRITFTRASTATFVGSNGFIQSAAINAPRFDYDPVTLAPKGLLIEEARTNLTAHSQNPSDLNWSATACTKTSTNNADPFNTSTALLLTADGTSAGHFLAVGVVSTISYTSGTTYTISCFVKAGTTNRIQLTGPGAAFGAGQYANFLLTGAGSITASAGGTATISQAPNGFYRITLSVAATATAASSGGILVFITTGLEARLPTNTSSSSILVIGWQTEAGSFATSYIPTALIAAARSADVATMTGTNFSSWFNPTQGTFVTSADVAASGVNRVIVGGGALGYPNYIRSTNVGAIFDAGSPIGTANSVTTAVFKLATNYGSSLMSACLNAETVASGAYNGNFATLTSVALGSSNTGTLFINGHIRSFAYYNTRLLNTQLQTLTQ